MATKKITELTAISTVSDTDVLPIIDTSELETKKVQIGTLKEYIVKNYHSKMLVIGDSWSAYNTSYVNDDNNLWHSILGRTYDLTVNNYSIGGAGFTVGNTSLEDEVDSAISEITDIDNYKYIFIFGGINDLTQNSSSSVLSSILSAITSISNKLKNHFTKSQIIIMGCNTKDLLDIGAYNSISNFNISEYMGYASSINNLTYINTIPFLLNETALFTNNHPNDTGHKVFASKLLSCLNGNGYSVKSTATKTYTYDINNIINDISIETKIYKDYMSCVIIFNLVSNYTGAFNITNLYPLTLIPNQYVSINQESSSNIVGVAQLNDNTFSGYINTGLSANTYRCSFNIPF